MARHAMSSGSSRGLFTRTAMKTHPRNLLGMPMRGGIRL